LVRALSAVQDVRVVLVQPQTRITLAVQLRTGPKRAQF
jgi:hypothetical protein